MNAIDVARQTVGLKPDDSDGIERVARRIVEEARRAPAAVLDATTARGRGSAVNPTYLLLQLDDAATGVLRERLADCSSARRRQYILWLLDAHRRQRGRVLVRLEALLDERRPLAPPDLPRNGDARKPPRRVCDDAFLIMRRLLAVPQIEDSAGADEAFLEMSLPDRNREIAARRSSQRWSEALKLASKDA
jgi:hypothetical protein